MSDRMPTQRCRRSLTRELNSPKRNKLLPGLEDSPNMQKKRKGDELESPARRRRFSHSSSDEQTSNMTTKSFYGGTKNRYVDPVGRQALREITAKSQETHVPVTQPAKKIHHKRKVASTKVNKKIKQSIKKTKKVEPKKEKSEEEFKVDESKKFFKHRISPGALSANIKQGKKGLAVKFNPQKLSKKRDEVVKGSLMSTCSRKPCVVPSSSPFVNPFSDDSADESLSMIGETSVEPSTTDIDSSILGSQNSTKNSAASLSQTNSSNVSAVESSANSSSTVGSSANNSSSINCPANISNNVSVVSSKPNSSHSSNATEISISTNDGSVEDKSIDVSDNFSSVSTAGDTVTLLSEVSSAKSSPTSSALFASCEASSQELVSDAADVSLTPSSGKKFFPIFAKGAKGKTSCPGTPSSSGSRTPKSTPKRIKGTPGTSGTPKHILKRTVDKDGMEQMMMDCGQKLIGAQQCPTCGMTYSLGEPGDEALHHKFHKRLLNTLKFPGWKKERVVQDNLDGSRIIMILPEDKNGIKKVEAVRLLIDEELGFVIDGRALKSTSKTFLYISEEKQIVGCCIAEVISQGYRVIEDSDASQESITDRSRPWCCSTESEQAKCGISRIWVLGTERCKGVATQLVDAVRFNFMLGCPLMTTDLAFSDPTPNGKIFATKYCKRHDFLVYKHSNPTEQKSAKTLK